MSPFERARSEALRVRCELLGSRASEAVGAEELLLAIDVGFELRVDPIAPSASSLSGADGILLRGEAIYVRNDVGLAERASLVTHEIGHFYMDDLDGIATVALLKALAVTGTPAVLKVESYGARARQELLANVFARELMMPRTVARALYEAGSGPKELCDRLGFELDVVRQQMLDGVLLPMAPLVLPPLKPFPSLSPDQLVAAEATEQAANVVAAPGTGKTTTLIHRVKHLITDRGARPAQILVLTFTNKAALELIERLHASQIPGAGDVWAGTFHAFGLEFLRRYHQHFKLPADVKVADKLYSVVLLNKVLPSVQLSFYKRLEDPYGWLGDVLAAIDRLKEELVTPAEYLVRINALPASDADRLRRLDVAALYQAYEKALQDAHMVDFVDLVSIPALAIAKDRALYAELADKYQFLLVDEYQDVTHAMVTLLRLLARGKASVWVVGDIRQAIHHWRGASAKSLTKFADRFRRETGTTTIQEYSLAVNRRSSKEILDVIELVGRRHVLESQPAFRLKPSTSSSGCSGKMPSLIACEPSQHPMAIAGEIEALRHAGVAFREQAVLSRKNGLLGRVADVLRARGVPTLYVGELVNRPEVKRLLCLMQLLTDRVPASILGLRAVEGLKLSESDYRLLVAEIAAEPSLQRGRWRNGPINGLSPAGAAAMSRAASLLTGMSRNSRAWSFVCDLLLERRFGFPQLSDQSLDAQVERLALWQFSSSTRVGDGEAKEQSLVRFLARHELRRRINDTYSERELPPEAAHLDAVRLMSIHGAKGLEFEAVHVPNVGVADFAEDLPDWMDEVPDILGVVPPEVLGSDLDEWRGEAAVERNNLLYVAVSRAKQHLVVYESDQADQTTPQFHEPLEALTCRQVDLKQATVDTNQAYATPTRTDPVPFAEFTVYAQCRLRHYYRFELRLVPEQEVDVSVRARSAVTGALREFARDRGDAQETLRRHWAERHAPDATADPGLWTDALQVYNRGIEWTQGSSGTFTELTSTVAGLEVRLPWLLLDPSSANADLVRLDGKGMREAKQLWQPMLHGLRPRLISNLTIRSLLGAATAEARPSGWVERTTAYKEATAFQQGDRAPKPGYACKTCPYSTICPSAFEVTAP